MGTLRGIITLVLMGAFIVLVVWLMSSRNKHRFDEAARLPLDDDAASTKPKDPSDTNTKS